MINVFTETTKNDVEKSRYAIGDKRLVCGFQVDQSSDIKSFISIEELMNSITSNANNINVMRLTNKVDLNDILITITEIEISEEHIVPEYPLNAHFNHKGYKGEFVNAELSEVVYLTNQYPVFLNGNRATWNVVPKHTDMPAYQLLKGLGVPERYFNLDSLCGYLEDNASLDDTLYEANQEALLNRIKNKLFNDFPGWEYRAKKLVKNIDFLTNVQITKHV